jgi:hypothetical protein
MVESPDRLPMPLGQLDPLADDPWLGPCASCGAEGCDYSRWFEAFVCEECFQAGGDAEE